jgi:hypothetical protein
VLSSFLSTRAAVEFANFEGPSWSSSNTRCSATEPSVTQHAMDPALVRRQADYERPGRASTLAPERMDLVVFLLWVAGAAIASLLGLLPYEGFRAWWEAHDRAARQALLRRAVE